MPESEATSGAPEVEDANYFVRRATNPGEAEFHIAEAYLPTRLDLLAGAADMDMELSGLRVGSLTAGQLKLGCATDLSTSEETRNFHVDIPLRGRALSRSGRNPRVQVMPGEAAVFPPQAPAQIVWSADCVQLCIMVPRGTLELELEMLLGRSLSTPLAFDFHMPKSGPLQGPWRSALYLIRGELAARSGLACYTSAGLHVQGLILDGLLLGHHHNYSALVGRSAAPGRRTAIARAVDLLQSRPGDVWTVLELAREVHLSVRALHEGFTRDVGVPPMTYLRRIRLHRARAELESSDPSQTTVRAVATRLGILHLGRFAATYKATFGESPSETLARSAT